MLHPSDIQTRAPQEVTTPGGLEQQADGTWLSKNCRVPIVGPGRIVSEINSSTVNVVGVGNGNLSNIVDTDIDNGCAIPAVIKAEVAAQVADSKAVFHPEIFAYLVGITGAEASEYIEFALDSASTGEFSQLKIEDSASAIDTGEESGHGCIQGLFPEPDFAFNRA